VNGFTPIINHGHHESRTTHLHAVSSLKPAAIPLLDSGKALARSGELLIDATTRLDIYGGGLSAVGANIRNAGDCVAQAAASCRFKTASELVCDELRESGTCLLEGVEKLKKAIDDAEVDQNLEFAEKLKEMMPYIKATATLLEAAGAGILQRKNLDVIGESIFQCGVNMEQLAMGIANLSPDLFETKESGNRMLYCAEKMREAGNNLKGVQPEKKKGKSWLKG
jgi:hypothetical protein